MSLSDMWRSDDGENRSSFTGDLQNRSEAFALSGGLSGFSDLKHDLFGKKKSAPSTFASDTFAALTRQQWADYQRDVMPYENKLIEFANSQTVVPEAMARAGTAINSAFDRQGGATATRLKSLGLTLNADEQQAADRSTGISRSLADVQAQNTAGAQTRGLQQALMGNPTPTIESLR